MIKYLRQNIIYLFLILTSLFSSIGALIYYVYKLNNLGIIISSVLSFVIFLFFTFFHYKQFRNKEKKNQYLNTEDLNKKNKNYTLYFIPYSFLLIILFLILIYHQTTQSIISPWQIIPAYFFIVYFIVTLVLIVQIIKNSHFSLFLISIHLFISTSIAWLIYKIGYGFDPFIHEATMDLIIKTGEVLPKTYYYIGQYSLIIIIHKITAFPILWLNKLLVPVLASIFLPYSIYKFLNKYFDNKRNIYLTIATLFIIPYSLFILTTPQNLSYIFLISVVFLSLACSSGLELLIIYLLAGTSILIHPIAGIPAMLFAFLITIYNSDLKKSKKYLYLITYLLTIISLPASFYFVNRNRQNKNILPEGPKSLLKNIMALFAIPSKENFILNFVYLYIFNIKFIIIFLALLGFFLIIKHKEKCKILFLNIYMSISLLISYTLIKKINFNFLIDYEKGAYAERILLITAIIILPVIAVALYNLNTRILSQDKYVKYIFLIFISILITTSLYASYPRFDRYFNSHGYSISQADIEAVNWIEDHHENSYIVLANQQVSVAALRKFGFNNYIKIEKKIKNRKSEIEIYNYPIPTGADLYQYYLKMVYEAPTKKTMLEAMEFTGVDEAYFVLNKYWWAFPKLLEEAKYEADSWMEIDDGEVYVFYYVK